MVKSGCFIDRCCSACHFNITQESSSLQGIIIVHDYIVKVIFKDYNIGIMLHPSFSN